MKTGFYLGRVGYEEKVTMQFVFFPCLTFHHNGLLIESNIRMVKRKMV